MYGYIQVHMLTYTCVVLVTRVARLTLESSDMSLAAPSSVQGAGRGEAGWGSSLSRECQLQNTEGVTRT